jgi:large subunit ribosomal protein L4
VRGSTVKIYRQKGTGKARHGPIRAPIFVGGGRAHPPRPKDWGYRPPRRVRSLALRGALSLLVKEGRFTVVEKIDIGEIKTKKLALVLTALKAPTKTLVVDDKSNENLRLSIRNLRDSRFLPPEGVNVYDLLRHEHLVVSKEAVKALEARCKGAKE